MTYFDDIPPHAGFLAVFHLDQYSVEKTFPTLRLAQDWIMDRRQFSADWRSGLARHGAVSRVNFRHTIRNLETGRFAPLERPAFK